MVSGSRVVRVVRVQGSGVGGGHNDRGEAKREERSGREGDVSRREATTEGV